MALFQFRIVDSVKRIENNAEMCNLVLDNFSIYPSSIFSCLMTRTKPNSVPPILVLLGPNQSKLFVIEKKAKNMPNYKYISPYQIERRPNKI